MQIVAFDFGTKKIGVAVGQTSTYTSSPLQVISSKDNKVKWNEIMILLNEWKPELVIVGKPLNMDGTDSEIMKEVEKFYQKLKSIYDAKFEYIDERLTTFEARQILEEKKFETVDANAAKILIDNWFELNKQ
ncbi:MAG: Holliday junction resolvase RuvX [Gammaproteobacteria bacterium]|jgi:putative Holliday junction resolvase|nr:Holliday junction resolvase RuvX [Gammaproteobacteria bacterium]OUW89863.1 MAG: Holliday junction resolvase RuvX [Gammaproteobacteria bacterium TMED234]OUW90662.1 MAG: Holliday junction resolvase RuvX [Gammaproteobacteria bacterium TMED234]|tara:strand:- start:116 stop:511 length:396 start_codon:yes stop_codon:yes gene_type:complete